MICIGRICILDPIDHPHPEVKKVLLVPHSCHFDLPPDWKTVREEDGSERVLKFDQGKFRVHMRLGNIEKYVFRLVRRKDGKSYDVAYDFPNILKSVLGENSTSWCNNSVNMINISGNSLIIEAHSCSKQEYLTLVIKNLQYIPRVYT